MWWFILILFVGVVVGIGVLIATKGGGLAAYIGSVFSRPHTPEGPDTGRVGEKLEYKTKGTDPLGVHKFQWDWDDPSTDPDLGDKWKDEKESHVYDTPGVKEIRVRERCPWWVFITRWSKVKRVIIT